MPIGLTPNDIGPNDIGPNGCGRRQFLLTSGAIMSATLLPAAIRAATTMSTEPHWAHYPEAIVIDSCGQPGRVNLGATPTPLDAGELADMRNSGVTALNFTVGSVGSYSNDYEETIKNIAYWDAQIATYPDVMMKVVLGAQLDEARRSKRLGIIYGFQDTTMYGENLDRFDIFHNFGIRIVQLTYNRRNLMGDGCLEPGNAGLSKLGHDMIAKMNERGVLVDLSHCGQRTTHEGIEASKKPVAVTHSGCTAIADMPRNKRDEELRLLADRGGVIGIYVMPYLRSEGQVMAEDVIRHIEHAIKVCGEDHVGIGTDGTISAVEITPEFKKMFADEVAERQKRGISAPGERADSYTFAPDLNTPLRYERIASMLSQRGHSDARIGNILGGNFARLFREVIV
ncbi:MAG: membrane dipeptidase [Rudaea sp.]|nr:membrane dipeptidase [Rudaea sp.]